MHDLLIRNATIVDGSGAPAYRGDLAVKDGLIAAVGDVDGDARETVDATGLTLAPGIIDTHTHYDAQLTWDPTYSPSSSLGVTTVIVGNCGFTIAPCRPADRDLTLRNLMEVEGMPIEALRAGVRWDFQTVPEYLDMIEASAPRLNVAAYVGHSALRMWVMGEESSTRAASDAEIAEMRALVTEGIAAGAIGFASSSAHVHNGAEGRPMPSRLSDEREYRALVGGMADAGRGIFMLTQGPTAPQTEFGILESIAATTGRPIMLAALLHNAAAPEVVFERLDQIKGAQDRGHRIWGHASCSPLTMDFTLAGAYPLQGLESWQRAVGADRDTLLSLYQDAGFRSAVKAELAIPARRMFNGDWARVVLSQAALPENAGLDGRTVADLAAEAGVEPLDWMIDFSLGEDLGTLFTAELLNTDDAEVARMLRHPVASIGLSDAGAHVSFLCDAGFGLRLLGHFVRDLEAMPIEEAVWQLSGRAAEIYGIADRGRLIPGLAADLFLFDAETVAAGPKRRVNDMPGGAARLVVEPVGVAGVWVNGARIVGGVHPPAEGAGRLLRRFAA